MINLEDHIVIHSGIKFVPLVIAQKAIEEAYNSSTTIDSAVEDLFKSFSNIQKSLEDNDKDSTRES
jgi:protein-arginine kinase